ncbi:MAG: preprotein translocase subunit SecA, partial [Bacteroidales bacterium]
MGFVEILSKLFGTKSQRDLKEINPYIDKIKAAYGEIEQLDNDGIRQRIEDIKERIQLYVVDEKKQIEDLKKSVEDLDLDEREKVWEEIDKIEKRITEKYEEVLEQVLPEVFSIVKDTARRF